MGTEPNDCCKVGRVAARRGLSGINDRLRRRWAAGASLRDLERLFAERVLAAALTEAGRDPLDGELSNLYRLLTDDSVSAADRIDAEGRLRREGVDPAAVVDDFVSYVTVRSHLNDCLDVDTDRSADPSAEATRESVYRLASRTESVTSQALERLATHDEVTVGDPTVTVSVRVACDDCGAEYTVDRFLERDGCSCD
jgi:hypothetical protein